MLAYLDLMMSEYGVSFQALWCEFPVVVGFALMEARRERMGGGGINYVDRAGLAAIQAEKLRLEREYRIIETTKP